MAITKLKGRQLSFEGAGAFTGSNGASNAVIADTSNGLVLSASRVYLQANPEENLEAATKAYVDAQTGTGGVAARGIVFGDPDGTGFSSNVAFTIDSGYDGEASTGDDGPFDVLFNSTTGSFRISPKSFQVTGSANNSQAIVLQTNAGAAEIITLRNQQGTVDGSHMSGSIVLDAAKGGIGISFADDKDLHVEGGRTIITANEDAAAAIKLHADAGSSQTIQIINDAGTTDGSEGAGAIDIEATVGGISLHAADDKDIAVEAGQVVITANHDTAEAIKLHADAGSSQTIQIINDAGTADGAEGSGAIDIEATVGGISLHAADDKDIAVEGGQVVLTANHDTAAAIKLHADAGSSQTIQIVNDAGTASTAIDIEATSGGFSVDGVQASNITVASAGDDDDLTISVTGANDASLLLSSAGTGDDAIDIHGSAGDVQFRTSASGKSVSIAAAGGGTQEVDISSAGTAATAIDINATAGGVTIDANAGVSIDAGTNSNFTAAKGTLTISTSESAANSDLSVLAGASMVLQAGEGAADAITINASGSAGGIDMDAGTGGIDIDSTGAVTINSTKNVGGSVILGTAGAAGGLLVQYAGNTQLFADSRGVGIKANVSFLSDGGILELSGSTSVSLPSYFYNQATVTSGTQVVNFGRVLAGDGILSASLAHGSDGLAKGISLTSGSLRLLGIGTANQNMIVPESLRIYQNGLLLTSGATADYNIAQYNFLSSSGAGLDIQLNEAGVVGDVYTVFCQTQMKGD